MIRFVCFLITFVLTLVGHAFGGSTTFVPPVQPQNEKDKNQ